MPTVDELRAGLDQLKDGIASLTTALATAREERDAAIARADTLAAQLAEAVKPVDPPGLAELVADLKEQAQAVAIALELAAPVDVSIRVPVLS